MFGEWRWRAVCIPIVFDWGCCLNYELCDIGVFRGGNGNSIWKVDGNGNKREWDENSFPRAPLGFLSRVKASIE